MAKRLLRTTTALYPVPAVLVTCGKEKPNIVTLAWVGTVCSEPPMLSISVRPSRFSHHLIVEQREFVVNLPSRDQLEATDYCGTVSGRDVDKFAETGLTPLPASKVGAPLIAECPVNIECVVQHTLRLGSHDIFVATVEAIHANEQALNEKGNVDWANAGLIAYMASTYWSLGEKLAVHGAFARKQSVTG